MIDTTQIRIAPIADPIAIAVKPDRRPGCHAVMRPVEVDLDNVWKGPPGTLGRWCRWLILATCAASIAIALLGWRLIWQREACEQYNGWWFRNAVWLGLLAVAAAALLPPPGGLARSIRLATVLPVGHLVAVIASTVMWGVLHEHSRADFALALPIGSFSLVAICAGLLAVVAAALSPRRTLREWLQTALVLVLSLLLLFGAWLPIVCSQWLRGADATETELWIAIKNPERLLDIAFAPPLIIAIAFTALTARRPRLLERRRAWVIGCVTGLLLVATVSQLLPRRHAAELYLQLAPLLLVGFALAIAVLVAAGGVTWLALHRARKRCATLIAQPGTIVTDHGHHAVAELELCGWLRAPRLDMHAFAVETAGGIVPIFGAEVLARVPPATTRLTTGERAALLRSGDAVVVYRRSESTSGHPFRSMAATGDVVIATPDARAAGLVDVALMMWRPSAAYLAIGFAIMLPALLALLTAR